MEQSLRPEGLDIETIAREFTKLPRWYARFFSVKDEKESLKAIRDHLAGLGLKTSDDFTRAVHEELIGRLVIARAAWPHTEVTQEAVALRNPESGRIIVIVTYTIPPPPGRVPIVEESRAELAEDASEESIIAAMAELDALKMSPLVMFR